MNYFDLCSSYPDQTIVAAWDTQVAEIARTPRLLSVFEKSRDELFSRFAACYTELRALPRGARRALQRQIARSSELTAIFPEWLQSGAGRALQHRLARSLAGAALLLALGQGTAHAVDITVNTTNPAINGLDGNCSLIEAIVNANDDAQTHSNCPAGSGADTIVLPAKTRMTVIEVSDNTYGPTGLPLITSPITIEGNGARITRKRSAPSFRLIAVSNSGDLTLQNLTLNGGDAPYDTGGGVYNSGGTLTIENSTISGNRAIYGGGVLNYGGTLTIENSTISGNRAVYGGGVLNYSALTIENSTISGNRAIYGGGVLNYGGIATIENSAISGNRAAYGGGVSNYGALTIRNSTISQNMARGVSYQGTKYGGDGGGVSNYGGTATIENSTISSNRADSGGGIWNNDAVNFNMSLISGNRAAYGYGPEIRNSGAFIGFANYNLVGSNGNAGVTGFTPGFAVIVPGAGVTLSRILGPLKFNGGPTKTHALKPHSPALDVMPLTNPSCTGTDQRGIARPQGTGCDIGAFERDGS